MPRPALLARLREVMATAAGGGKVDLVPTLEELERAVTEAAESGVRNLLVGGGDGTLHIVLNQSQGLGFTYGLVPMGTINALARCLDLPRTPVAARQLVALLPEQRSEQARRSAIAGSCTRAGRATARRWQPRPTWTFRAVTPQSAASH